MHTKSDKHVHKKQTCNPKQTQIIYDKMGKAKLIEGMGNQDNFTFQTQERQWWCGQIQGR